MSFRLTGRPSGAEAVGLSRPALLAEMALAAALCGEVLDGNPAFVAGAFAAFDWLLAGLFNRISDVPEDLRNGVAGAAYAERNAGALMRIVVLALIVSLAGAKPLGTPLLVVRCLFHAGAFAYSFPTVVERLKEKLLLKNAVAGLLAAFTSVGYPLALRGDPAITPRVAALGAVVLLVGTAYTLVRDLRDAEADAACGLVTVPVKWGPARTRALVAVLLASSAFAGYLAWAASARG